MSLRNLKSVFVKPDEQSQACLRFAMARKGALKRNIIFRQSYIKTLISRLFYVSLQKNERRNAVLRGAITKHKKPL